MGLNTEKRLAKLENEIKALKATYTVYGGLMKLYESVSPEFPVNPWVGVIVKFQSSYTTDSMILVSSINIIVTSSGGVKTNLSPYAYTDIQNGDGSITINTAILIGTNTIQITVISTSPGTFTQIQ